MTARLLRALGASLLLATSVVVGGGAPASAAACGAGQGVTVVVDPQQLGGGDSVTCVVGVGGQSASSIFGEAAVGLTRVTTEPGAVCRVNGAPSNANCGRMPPANAYWSLWWSKGDGTWIYANLGVDGLKVPQGGWLAWSWQGQNAKAAPSVTPRNASAGGSSAGSPSTSGGGSSSRGTSGTPSPSSPAEKKAAQKQKAEKQRKKQLEKAKRKADEKAGRTPSASAATSGSQESDEAVRNASQEGAGPGSGAWIAILAVLALGGTAGFTAWRRHRTP